MLGFSLSDFCTQTRDILSFVGWILTIFKIAIPFIIIIYGIIDLGKAVTASKEDETKAAAKRLAYRAAAGVAIFFIPSLVLWLFGTISDFSESSNGFETCKQSLLYPWNSND